MSALYLLQNFFYSLIHPFQANQKARELVYEGEGSSESPVYQPLSLYESLGASWIFVVISGMLKILLINGVILLFLSLKDTSAHGLLDNVYNGDGFTGFYFVIFTTILDVIFYPLVTLFVIQFWEFIFKVFANLAAVEGDIEKKSQSILSVALSSHALQVIPVFGDIAQKCANFIQMYAGLRVQFGFSRSLTLCVLFTPILMMLGLFSVFALLAAL